MNDYGNGMAGGGPRVEREGGGGQGAEAGATPCSAMGGASSQSQFGADCRNQPPGGMPPGESPPTAGQPSPQASWTQALPSQAPATAPGPSQWQAPPAPGYPGNGAWYGSPNATAAGPAQAAGPCGPVAGAMPPWGAAGFPPYPHQASPGYGPAPQAMGHGTHPGSGAAGPHSGAGVSQLMQEIAGGGSGLSSLSQMLNLDDKELWKGALIGAAAVLLLTNESVQNALFKSGVRARDAMKSGVDKVKATAAGASADSPKESNKAPGGGDE